jgi:alanine dehydrogenase
MASLTWLDSAAVRALMPTVEEQLDLVAETYVAMARGRVELPPKPGLHPREDSFLNAMPAWLMDRDVVAMKWVAAYPGNSARGLPAISGLVVVNDPDTGAPEVVMDAEEITAVRTAVASGVAIRHLAPPGWRRVAILGYGAQGRSHAEVVRTLRPDAEVVAWGPRLAGPVDGVTVAEDPRAAVEGADVVVTAGPMPRERRPVVAADWLAQDCLVLPVDYDARVLPEVSHAADDFLVDDLPQFRSFVERGSFGGWAAPRGSLGEALQRDPVPGRTLVCSLGVGAVDAVIAGVVRDRSRASGLGVPLRR